MDPFEKDDKQIESAAKSVKAFLINHTNSKKEAHDISDKIDRIENELKTLNRMTNGKFAQFVNNLSRALNNI